LCPGNPGTIVAEGPAGLPRVGLVFSLWKRDKENHGRREGLPLVLSGRIGPATGLHPPDVFNVERKKNTAFGRFAGACYGLAGIKGLLSLSKLKIVNWRRFPFIATRQKSAAGDRNVIPLMLEGFNLTRRTS
jgi:hypothetical protein